MIIIVYLIMLIMLIMISLIVYLCILNTIFCVIIIALTIIFLILLLMSHVKFEVNKFDIVSPKIDKNIKIMLMSDMHNREISNKIVKIISEEAPDYIIMCGDMINENLKETKNFIKLLDKIDSNKIYYIFGNHEEELCESDKDEYYKILKKYKINLLNNKSVKLSNNIILNGICIPYEFYKFMGKKITKKDFDKYLNKCETDKYNILVAHNPLWNLYYEEFNYDLCLSGHVHGGMFRFPFIGGIFSPDYKFFPKYSKGKYEVGKMTSIVSSGIGYSRRIKMRILNPGEVVIINLLKK